MDFCKIDFNFFRSEMEKKGFSVEKAIELYEKIRTPQRGTSGSAGYDIENAGPTFVIQPRGEYKLITGIRIQIDGQKFLSCLPRSSAGIKKNLSLKNTEGVIDSDYFSNKQTGGHIFAVLKNNSDEPITVENGERVIQGIISPFFITDNDKASVIFKERIGGTGSTGR